MSRLPVVSAKELEKLLLKLGFEISRQKAATVFINILMAVIPQFRTTRAKIFRGLLSGPFCDRLNSMQMIIFAF
jgi:hypothetical protein